MGASAEELERMTGQKARAVMPVFDMAGETVLFVAVDPEEATDRELLIENTIRLRVFADLIAQFAGAAQSPGFATMAKALGMMNRS